MVWNIHRPQGPPLWGHPGVGALLRSGPCLGCLGSFMLCTEGHRASESQEARWKVRATHVPVHTHLPRAHPRLPCTPTCAEAEPSCSLVSLGNQAEAKITQGDTGGGSETWPE